MAMDFLNDREKIIFTFDGGIVETPLIINFQICPLSFMQL